MFGQIAIISSCHLTRDIKVDQFNGRRFNPLACAILIRVIVCVFNANTGWLNSNELSQKAGKATFVPRAAIWSSFRVMRHFPIKFKFNRSFTANINIFIDVTNLVFSVASGLSQLQSLTGHFWLNFLRQFATRVRSPERKFRRKQCANLCLFFFAWFNACNVGQ